METDDRWSHTARQHGQAGAMSDAEAGRCVVIKPIVFTRRTFSLSCTYQPAVPVLTVIIWRIDLLTTSRPDVFLVSCDDVTMLSSSCFKAPIESLT